MDREDRIDIYTLPPNFAEEGTMFSGRVKSRNAVETAIILMVLVPLLFSLDTTVKVKLYIGMIVFVPIVVLAAVGIQGESLFSFIAGFFRYLWRRRCLTAPDERYRLEQNRRKEKARKGGKQVHGKKKEGRGDKDGRFKGKAEKKNPAETEPGMEKAPEKNKKSLKTGTKAKTGEPGCGKGTKKGTQRTAGREKQQGRHL